MEGQNLNCVFCWERWSKPSCPRSSAAIYLAAGDRQSLPSCFGR